MIPMMKAHPIQLLIVFMTATVPLSMAVRRTPKAITNLVVVSVESEPTANGSDKVTPNETQRGLIEPVTNASNQVTPNETQPGPIEPTTNGSGQVKPNSTQNGPCWMQEGSCDSKCKKLIVNIVTDDGKSETKNLCTDNCSQLLLMKIYGAVEKDDLCTCRDAGKFVTPVYDKQDNKSLSRYTCSGAVAASGARSVSHVKPLLVALCAGAFLLTLFAL